MQRKDSTKRAYYAHCSRYSKEDRRKTMEQILFSKSIDVTNWLFSSFLRYWLRGLFSGIPLFNGVFSDSYPHRLFVGTTIPIYNCWYYCNRVLFLLNELDHWQFHTKDFVFITERLFPSRLSFSVLGLNFANFFYLASVCLLTVIMQRCK